MSINKTKQTNYIDDIFDKDFEVIYEGELPELPNDLGNDDYKDALSNLSELDPTNSMDIDYLEQNRTRTLKFSDKTKSLSNRSADTKEKKSKKGIQSLLSPASKTVKAGGKATWKATETLTNLLLRAATLILIIAITGLLAVNFWKHNADYGNISSAVAEHNYILGAYFGTALFFLLVECFTFLTVLFGSKTRHDKNGRRIDSGRGLFSFIFIYLCSWLSYHFASLIPSSPTPLQGVKGALSVYGSLNHILLILCVAGVISCIVRKFIIK